MALPYFFTSHLSDKTITLDEDTSKHMIGVLRMCRQEALLLTDGKGRKARAVIVDDHRKRCTVEVEELTVHEAPAPQVAIGISLTKNAVRFEWFLEKATEIGINEIIPLVSARTAKEKFRLDRMQGILTSALLQSQQTWLPRLHEPTAYEAVLATHYDRKFIAHCTESQKTPLTDCLLQPDRATASSMLLLIGPEGDFTPAEISEALQQGFQPVTLGATRLRTETAGMVAATLLRLLSAE